MSSKFGRIRPLTTELSAIERMKKSQSLIKGIFNRILFIFVGNEDMHKSLDEFGFKPDATTGFHGNR